MEQARELSYILCFISECGCDEGTTCEQIRCLWTAFCLHQETEADTSSYDITLMEIWRQLTAVEADAACWHDYDSFSNFMCAFLV